MEGERVDSALDLSHLTEEEQASILEVLQRDLELRHRDEGRVSQECSKRHRRWTSGCDLIRATIRHRKTRSRETDVPLNELFSGEREETSSNEAPETTERLEDSGGSDADLKSAPKIKSPVVELSGSMMSLFSSGDFGVVEVRGRIQYSLVYDAPKEELRVNVYRCEDIASARKNRSDPYVKTYLLPDKSNHSKKKTSVRKKTLNPVYDQTLRPLGRNVFLGEVEVALELWDWTCTQPLWQDLQPRVCVSPDSISSRGNIMLSIKFIPEGFEGGGMPLTGEVHIWLREAQGLLSNKGGAVDSFVRSRQSGQKTRVVKHSISPTYNHTMVYDGFHTSDLKEACAELTVWQREGLKVRILGGIRLSSGTGQSYGEDVSWMDSTGEEVAVWTSMIQNPNHWIDTRLPIRTNLTQRPV
ncbi:unnamed protein product [Menidia menidia]|uniref:(Atlantic silverside) hypothetical protein n=1 Tax=Menidia menidia TaxID=238744 RepID=A0A8S4BU91_9TELE|nr:unnamed protein product [Menidia menidia]